MVSLIQKLLMGVVSQLGWDQAVGDILSTVGLPRDFQFHGEHLPNGILTHYSPRKRLAGLYLALAKTGISRSSNGAEVMALGAIHGETCRIQIVWPNGMPKVAA